MLWRVWIRFRNRSSFDFRKNRVQGLLVLDGTGANEALITRYIATMTGQDVSHFIGRDDLPGAMECAGERPPLRWFVFALGIAFSCIWKSDRQHRALGIPSVIELTLILEYALKHEVTAVVDFAPYLIDSNLLFLLLKRHGVKVVKVPSSGPLKTHNHILLSDEVALSTPYHEYEADAFANTFKVSKRLKWIPERALEYASKYARTDGPRAPSRTLGFYSHGGWVRAAGDHSSDGLSIHAQEEQLLKVLGQWIQTHPDWTLVVFPHPREKAASMLEKTMNYYGRFLSLDRVDLRLSDLPTSQQFEAADVGVAVFSTIVYERLFCGYKTRIFNTANTDFPARGTDLDALCARNADALTSSIEEAASRSPQADFQACGVLGYRWDAFEDASWISAE